MLLHVSGAAPVCKLVPITITVTITYWMLNWPMANLVS
jgi:hypothetical protein